jgi:hypothetical protein
MYKSNFILLFLIFFSQYPIFSQFNPQNNTSEILKNVVSVLAHDSLEGRDPRISSINKSIAFLDHYFHQLTKKKLKHHHFNFTHDSILYPGINAYYFLNNHQTKTVLISAHYDHIGYGGELSKSFTNQAIHNGADDNASGVGVLLALAENLMKQKKHNCNYVFIFYSAHELGLYGSKAFIEMAIQHKKFRHLALNINFDMVGRMDTVKPSLRISSSFPIDYSEFEYLIPAIKKGESEILQHSDCKHTLDHSIPSMHITAGTSMDYHKTTDDEVYINYRGMQMIYQFICSLLTPPNNHLINEVIFGDKLLIKE